MEHTVCAFEVVCPGERAIPRKGSTTWIVPLEIGYSRPTSICAHTILLYKIIAPHFQTSLEKTKKPLIKVTDLP